MTLTQILILVGLAAISTVLTIRVIPRTRRNLWFEAVLWLATGIVALLGGMLVISTASDLAVLHGLASFTFQDLPLIPASIGALGGALVLNLPLWLLDRSEREAETADPDEDLQ